ncbi:methyl-accepting chemotaxis protein [Halobacterium wangiae]|uniref:methyl-accepting chemotaxis protein n=1 Tax=Halobacterium wangiae TaxID=2902623 RepID=UPI001E2E3525|nr:methyl-accepting chemotaxis protein [Halobacterium wangiae]
MSSQRQSRDSGGGVALYDPPDGATETERLRDERDFWKHLFEDLTERFPEPVLVVDDEGHVTHWNNEQADIQNTPAEAVVGEVAHDVVGTDDVTETLAEEVVRTEETVNEDRVRSGVNENGEQWHVSAAALPLYDPEGDVVGSFEMVSRVTDLVEQRSAVKDAQEQITTEVDETVGDLLASSERVAENSQFIEETASTQVESLASVRNEVESLSATVEEIASQTDEVDDRASDVADDAAASVGATEEAKTLLADVEDAGRELDRTAAELDDEVAEIDDVVDVIGDIVSQINILALNANIEAARTDGNNDGFAVVADEIKALANQSQQEVDAIEETIGRVTDIVEETTDSVDRTTSGIAAVADRIDTIGDRQEAIREAAEETAVGMTEIAEATDEQAVSAEEVTTMLNDALDSLEEVVAEIGDLAAENDEQATAARDVRERIHAVEADLEDSLDA